MKKIIVIGLLVIFLMMTATTAFADNKGPCNDSPDPGNSSYAKHHIVVVAKSGGMGNDGHKPGVAHQGYSACDPSG